MLNKACGISTNPLKKKFYLGVEAADCDSCTLVRQPQKWNETLRTDIDRPRPTPVNHFPQCCFHQAERQEDWQVGGSRGDLRNKPRCKVSPVFAQKRKRFPGRGLQWERQTTQFKDGNSALHHVFCSWDSEGPATRREIIKHKVATVCVPHHIRRYLLPSPGDCIILQVFKNSFLLGHQFLNVVCIETGVILLLQGGVVNWQEL